MVDVNTNGKNLADSMAAQGSAPGLAEQNNQDPTKSAMQDLGNSLGQETAQGRDIENLFQKEEQQNINEEAKKTESFLTYHSRQVVSIGELLASLPLIFSSMVGQAENIIDHEEKSASSFLLNYITTSINTLSYPFIKGLRKFVPQPKNIDDVSVNKRPFVFDDINKRISQKAVVRQVVSFIFSMRRSLFEFFPTLFTVPAEEHDPNNPRGSSASAFKKNIFSLGNIILSPLRFTSSLFSSLVSLPSHALGAISAYGGNQKAFNFAKFGSEVSDIIMPLVSNLSSLSRVTKAYMESWQTNKSKSVKFDEYNIGFTNLVQAVFGGVTAIPYFFGAMSKITSKLLESSAGESKLAVLARDFVSSVSLLLKSMGLYAGNTAGLQHGAYQFVTKGLRYLRSYSEDYLDKFMNANPLTKSFFKKFRPTDLEGNVISGGRDGELEAGIKDGYVFNRFKKSSFFDEIYELTHPLQSALMVLPNAFVELSDPYVQDNGSRILRWVDRIVGLNSLVLSLPSVVIYLAKTRLPQLILKYFETKQRKMDLGDQDYDAYREYINFIKHIEESSIPGTGYMSITLKKLDLQRNDFRNANAIKAQLEFLETKAKEQEHSIKASELVQAMRIGLRHLIATQNSLFFASRDEQGYTVEEQNRMKIHDAVNKFGTTIRGIPILGWFGAPLIDVFSKMYKVKQKEGLKLLGPKPNASEMKASGIKP